MPVSFFAVKFFEASESECTHEAFEIMFKRTKLQQARVRVMRRDDYCTRGLRSPRSTRRPVEYWFLYVRPAEYCRQQLLACHEGWRYLDNIVLMGPGLYAGITAMSTNLNSMPDAILTASLIDRLACFEDPTLRTEPTINNNKPVTSEIKSS